MGSRTGDSDAFTYFFLDLLIRLRGIKNTRSVHNHNFMTKSNWRLLFTFVCNRCSWIWRIKCLFPENCVTCGAFSCSGFSKYDQSYFINIFVSRTGNLKRKKPCMSQRLKSPIKSVRYFNHSDILILKTCISSHIVENCIPRI